MPLIDTYSRRKRNAAKTGSDVYQYVDISPKLRRQIIFVFEDIARALSDSSWERDTIWNDVAHMMRRELGVSLLYGHYTDHYYEEIANWFLDTSDLDSMLDAIEYMCAFGEYAIQHRSYNPQIEFSDYVDELNGRFLEAGVGFQVERGQIIEVSAQFIHAEAVVPVLSLLAHPKLKTADEEFRKAHREFRARSYEDCLIDCLKAFESVLKVISVEKKWQIAPNATAKDLIKAAYDNQLVPTWMQSEFTGLRSILEAGVPTVRNKAAGHGQGTAPRNVSANLASFQLHQTASAILFLAKEAGLG